MASAAQMCAGLTARRRRSTPLSLDWRASLKAGSAGKAAVKVKGKGFNLALPDLPLAQDPRVTVQLQSSDGACWEAVYGTATRNDEERFSAKSD
jgi:hypothetical protein